MPGKAKSPVPADEPQRLARLRALNVLDTDPEPIFDGLTRAAALVAGVPIALVSLIDAERQWFKSNIGLEGTRETPRDIAFCAHAILGDDLMEVPDAKVDPRFARNPLVKAQPNIRFYAGAPIILHDGLRMGTLCVIDREPRTLTSAQRAILIALARAAAEAIDQRALALERTQALEREATAIRLQVEDHRRLSYILDGTRAGTWEWNVQTGEAHFNERWAEILGLTLDELQPISVNTGFDRVHADDVKMSTLLLEQHLAGEIPYFECELRLRHKQRHWVWVHVRGSVASRSDDGKPLWMCGTHVDISARKQIESRLRDSEAFLDRTSQLAGIGGWEVNLLTQEITWSDETCRIHDMPTGYRPTMREGIDFYAADARAVVEAAVQKALIEGTGWDLELPLTTARGRDIWVRTVGSAEFDGAVPTRLVGAFQDITFRKRAVRTIEISEQRFRKLFEASRGLIFTHDMDGVILSMNPAAAQSLGYPLALILGRNLGELMPSAQQKNLKHYLQRIVDKGNDSGKWELIAADGSRHSWEFHNILDNADQDSYVLGNAQDTTERDRYEQQLREWSTRDALTGCFNRRRLQELATSIHKSETWGCIVIDLDRFKQINDTFGHARGDQVLVAMAAFLSERVRPNDLVIRSGGDEFLILLKGSDEERTTKIIERLRNERDQAPIEFTLGHSIRNSGDSLEETIAAADKRLYEARATARSR